MSTTYQFMLGTLTPLILGQHKNNSFIFSFWFKVAGVMCAYHIYFGKLFCRLRCDNLKIVVFGNKYIDVLHNWFEIVWLFWEGEGSILSGWFNPVHATPIFSGGFEKFSGGIERFSGGLERDQ